MALFIKWEGSAFFDTGQRITGASGTFQYPTIFGEGSYYFYTKAVFSPCRAEADKGFAETATLVDRGVPGSVCSSPAFAGDDPFPIGYVADEDNVNVYLYYSYEGGAWQDSGLMDSGSVGTFMFDAGSSGNYGFHTIAIDQAGTYIIEGNTVGVGWTQATDPDGVVSYEYGVGTLPGGTDLLDYTNVGYGCTPGACAVIVSGVNLPEDNSIYASVMALNEGGMASAPKVSPGALVDTAPPVLVSSAPNDGDVLLGESISITALIRDIGSGIDSGSWPAVVLDYNTLALGTDYIETWTGSTVEIAITATGRSKLVEINPGSKLGTHNLRVMASDLAGNPGLDRVIVFTIDKPDLVVVTPSVVNAPTGSGPITFRVQGGTGPYEWSWTGDDDSVIEGATTLSYTPGWVPGSYMVAAVDSRGVSFAATIKLTKELFMVQPQAVGLAPGETQEFRAVGGAPPYSWYALGGTIQIDDCDTGEICDTFLYAAGDIYGEYTISVLDSSSPADSVNAKITITEDVGRAIIVTGGGLVDDNRLVNSINYLANFAYRTLISRGFTPDKIFYMNPNSTQPFDGNGDGTADPIDIVELAKAVRGLGPNYANVIPQSGLGQDLDGDGTPSPTDLTELKKMVRGLSTVGMGSRPNSLVVMEQPGGTVALGDTCHVTVGVLNANSTYSPAFGVIFKIGAGSTGAATVLGGEGASAPGRYDVSGDTGSSRVVLKIEGAGTILLEATIPGCGVPTVGRYCPVINAPVVTIIGE